MRSLRILTLMRRPRLRRFGAWLAIFALALHTVAMAAHQPALAVATPVLPYDAHALCLSGEAAPGHHDDSEQPGDHHSKAGEAPCPLCQRLGALDSYLPVLLAILIAPSTKSGGVVAEPAPAQPPRLALTSLNPRGPPSLI